MILEIDTDTSTEADSAAVEFSIKEIKQQAKGLGSYNNSSEVSIRSRTRDIHERRPLIAALDAHLRDLKSKFAGETRSKKGFRVPNGEYTAKSLDARMLRKQLSMVQSADRRNLKGKL